MRATHDEPDAARLLREMRPDAAEFDPEGPAARAALERILATTPVAARPSRRRRARRLVMAGAAAAAVAAAVVAADPFVRGSTDVIARASEALGDDEVILHYVAHELHKRGRKPLDERDPATFSERTMEVWQTADRRQERFVLDGGFESVHDIDARTSLSYVPSRDLIIRYTTPALFTRDRGQPEGLDAGVPMSVHTLGDVARMMERARSGDENVRVVGETTVRGVPVHEVRIDFEVDVLDTDDQGRLPAGSDLQLPTRKAKAGRVVYLRRDTYMPVRVVELAPGETITGITDFAAVERLPRTVENERLLQMSPHPGAREEVRD